jgi:hypothetical protein
MSKQFAAFHVSWRDANRRPLGIIADETAYGRAAAQALEAKLNELAGEGWILDRIIPASGLTPRQTSAFTVIVFK